MEEIESEQEENTCVTAVISLMSKEKVNENEINEFEIFLAILVELDFGVKIVRLFEYQENSDLISLRRILKINKVQRLLVFNESQSKQFDIVYKCCKDILTDFETINLLEVSERIEKGKAQFNNNNIIGESFHFHTLQCLYLLTERVNSIFEVERGFENEFMKIDETAIDALDVFSNDNTSIYNILNKCCTKRIGGTLLKEYLYTPLTSKVIIESRQNFIKNFIKNIPILDKLRSYLKTLPDIYSLIQKLRKLSCTLEDLYSIYMFVTTLPSIVKLLRKNSNKEDYTYFLSKTLEELISENSLNKFCALIENVIEFDFVPQEFRVRCAHDETGELKTLNDEWSKISDKVTKEKNKLMNVLEGLAPKYEKERKFINTYGYHFRISKKHDNILKKLSSDEYVYLKVVNSGIRWTSFKLKELYDKEMEIKSQINSAESVLLKDALDVASTFLPLLEKTMAKIAEIDVLASFAFVSAHAPTAFVKPTFVLKKTFKVTKSRHPSVELLENVSFVPNDFNITEDTRLQIITGPNMGGKSTYIRQLGIICLLAQIGCYVPADSATLSIVDSIFTRIGADDDQTKGMSTFLCEMQESSTLLKNATKYSLAIVDEIGRGTSTAEGYGLAYGIAYYLASELKCSCLFATHFHELTQLEDEVEGVKNIYFDAITEDENVIMLYEVKTGTCNKSYGINIARMAGFPQHVIKNAEEKLKELERGFNDSVQGDTLRKRLLTLTKDDFNSYEAVAKKMKLTTV